MLKRTVIALLLSLGTVALAHAGKAAVSSKDATDNRLSLVVSANGRDEPGAIKKAVALAAERAFGVYVLDRTSFDRNGQVVASFSEMASNGIVKFYKVLQSVRDEHGDQVVTIEATVDPVQLEQEAQSGQRETWKDALNQLALISTEQQRLRTVNDMLNTLTGPTPQDFFNRAYNVDFVRYEIKEILPNSVSLDAIVRISLNSVFWKTYMSVVSAGASAVGTKLPEGMFEVATAPAKSGKIVSIAKTAYVGPGVAPALVPPLQLEVKIAGSNIKLAVWKNGFFSFTPAAMDPSRCCGHSTEQIRQPLDLSCLEYRIYSEPSGADIYRPISLFKSGDIWFREPYNAYPRVSSSPARDWSVLGNSVTVAIPVTVKNEQAVVTLPRIVTTDIRTLGSLDVLPNQNFVNWELTFKAVAKERNRQLK